MIKLLLKMAQLQRMSTTTRTAHKMSSITNFILARNLNSKASSPAVNASSPAVDAEAVERRQGLLPGLPNKGPRCPPPPPSPYDDEDLSDDEEYEDLSSDDEEYEDLSSDDEEYFEMKLRAFYVPPLIHHHFLDDPEIYYDECSCGGPRIFFDAATNGMVKDFATFAVNEQNRRNNAVNLRLDRVLEATVQGAVGALYHIFVEVTEENKEEEDEDKNDVVRKTSKYVAGVLSQPWLKPPMKLVSWKRIRF